MRFGDASLACRGHTFSLVESKRKKKYHKAIHIVETVVLVEEVYI